MGGVKGGGNKKGSRAGDHQRSGAPPQIITREVPYLAGLAGPATVLWFDTFTATSPTSVVWFKVSANGIEGSRTWGRTGPGSGSREAWERDIAQNTAGYCTSHAPGEVHLLKYPPGGWWCMKIGTCPWNLHCAPVLPPCF